MKQKKRRTKLSGIPKEPPPLSDEIKLTAKYIAMAVRNAMEDFHCKHLSDEQMRELNPIIRNAIATALYAMEHTRDNPLAEAYVLFNHRMIPYYWEAPELIGKFSRDEFIDEVKRSQANFDGNPNEAEVEAIAERALNLSLSWPFTNLHRDPIGRTGC